MNPEWLRYYFAAKLNSTMEDLDLNFQDFTARVNSDLVGKFVNIASRSAGFLSKRFDGVLSDISGNALLATLRAGAPLIASFYDQREFGKAIREIMALTDQVNGYVDQNKPWELAKQAGQDAQLQEVCTVCLEAFRLLSIYLKPVLPTLVGKVESLLNIAALSWADVANNLGAGHRVAPFVHLMQRVEAPQIASLIQANTDSLQPSAAPQQTPSKNKKAAPEKPMTDAPQTPATIGIEDFTKLDLRMGKVVECKRVEGSTKLLQLTVDLGESEHRNIFSGISAHYSPEQMTGKMVIVVANLAPRKMKFGVSQGMVLCASPADDTSLFVLTADSGALPGMKVS
jgi:methionyl-tRNA synthetase